MRLTLAALCLLLAVAASAGPKTTRFSLDGTWQMAHTKPGSPVPARGWVAAAVPGSAQAALAEAVLIQNPYDAKNSDRIRWMEREEWWFRREFTPAGSSTSKWRIEFDGVDYACTVWLNSKQLGRHKGMFDAFSFDMTGTMRPGRKNTLLVRIDPPPQYPVGFDTELKTQTLYAPPELYHGWAYLHLLTVGIWRPVRLVETPAGEIKDPFVRTVSTHGRIRVSGETTAPGTIEITIRGATFRSPGQVARVAAATGFDCTIAVRSPRLWWPNGLGSQNLYTAAIRLRDMRGRVLDERTVRFGIRTITATPNAGGDPAWLPWTFTVNGKPFFVRGANWIAPADVMNRPSPALYRRLIWLAKQAGMQIFRVWGGGTTEGQTFYDLCDEAGILVWEESPLGISWWNYDKIDRAQYRRTVLSQVLATRNHPSLAMYCGGNEWDANVPANKVLVGIFRDVSTRYDGTRLFRPVSPWGGETHDYVWGVDQTHYSAYTGDRAAFVGEFGSCCLPDLACVRTFVPAKELTAWPPPAGGSFAHHQIYPDAWCTDLMLRYAEEYGEVSTYQEFAEQSQLCEARAVSFGIGHFRASWPRLTGCMIWQMHDFWPAITNSLVDFGGSPKMAYYYVKRAYAPISVAARFDRGNWASGEEFAADVLVMSDSRDLNCFTADVAVYGARLRLQSSWIFPVDARAGKPLLAGRFTWTVGSAPFAFVVTLRDNRGEFVDRQVYWLNLDALKRANPAQTVQMRLGKPDEPNAVMCRGQTIAVPSGSYRRLLLLNSSAGSSTQGVDGTVTLRYSDGSTADQTFRWVDWIAPSGVAGGERDAVAERLASRLDRQKKRWDGECAIYATVLALDPSRKLFSVTLPADAGPDLRRFVFGLAVDNGARFTQVDVSSRFDQDVVGSERESGSGDLLYGCAYPESEWRQDVSFELLPPPERLRKLLAPTRLAARLNGRRLTITNVGPVPAFEVSVSVGRDRGRLVPSDSHFWLDAGESRTVTLDAIPEFAASRSPEVVTSAWNAAAIRAGR